MKRTTIGADQESLLEVRQLGEELNKSVTASVLPDMRAQRV